MKVGSQFGSICSEPSSKQMHFRHVLAFLLGAVVGPACWASQITHDYTFAAPTITQVVIEGTTYHRHAREGYYKLFGSEGPSERFHRWFWDAVFNSAAAPDPDPPGLACSYGAENQYSKEKNLWRFLPPQEAPPGWAGETGVRWCFYELNLFGDPSLIIRKQP